MCVVWIFLGFITTFSMVVLKTKKKIHTAHIQMAYVCGIYMSFVCV